jgi:hypothetical protein
MSTLRARRKPWSLSSESGAARPSRDYDDRPYVDEPLEEILPGQALASGLADADEGGESDVEVSFERAETDSAGEDVTVPVIPKRTDEFICSSCFLIHHRSRLASSKGGQLLCTDCA